jgi:hypothetical protein
MWTILESISCPLSRENRVSKEKEYQTCLSLVKERKNYLFKYLKDRFETGFRGAYLWHIAMKWVMDNTILMDKDPEERVHSYKRMYGTTRTCLRQGIIVKSEDDNECFYMRGPRWHLAEKFMAEFKGQKINPVYQNRIIALRQEMREMV